MLSDTSTIENGTSFWFGPHHFTFGKEIIELTNSSGLLGDVAALRRRMAEDGYLFFRSFFDRQVVLRARQRALDFLSSKDYLKEGTRVEDGIIGSKNKNAGLFRNLEVSESPEVLSVVNSPLIFEFFSSFLGGEILTFDHRWLRAMAKGGNNSWHYDSVFMSRGTQNLYSCWTPLGDISLEQGGLVLALGSHKHERLKETYGRMDSDRDCFEPNFTEDPGELVEKFGFKLATTNYRAGDLLIFGIYMLHASSPNTTDRYRLSIDTRYQLASEPVDERFMGKNGQWRGNYNYFYEPKIRIKDLRTQWGL